MHFGSVNQCFKRLDADGNGLVSLVELRRACHKFSWDGDVQILFGYFGAEGGGVSGEGRHSVRYGDFEFLDSWATEATEQELGAPVDSEETLEKKKAEKTRSE